MASKNLAIWDVWQDMELTMGRPGTGVCCLWIFVNLIHLHLRAPTIFESLEAYKKLVHVDVSGLDSQRFTNNRHPSLVAPLSAPYPVKKAKK